MADNLELEKKDLVFSFPDYFPAIHNQESVKQDYVFTFLDYDFEIPSQETAIFGKKQRIYEDSQRR